MMGRVISPICVLLLALAWQQQPVSANPFILAKTAFQFAMQINEGYDKIKAFMEGPPTENDQLTAKDVKIFDKLNGISKQLSDVQYSLLNKINGDELNRLTDKAGELFKEVRYVQDKFKKFTGYTNNHQNSTKARFYEEVTSPVYDNLGDAVSRMYDVLTSRNLQTQTLLSLLSQNKYSDLMCIRGQSMQEIIHDIFKMVLITDAQSVIIKTFAYEKLEESQNKNFDAEKADVTEGFNSRIHETYADVQNAMSTASRQLFKCEPPQHKKKVTYWKLEEIFQGYIHYEYDLYGACKWGSCPELNDRHPECRSEFCLNKQKHKRCQGHIIDCNSLSSKMSVCNAPDKSYRKYSWLETASGTVYGQKQSCGTELEVREPSHATYLVHKCEHCLCTCVSEKLEADRYFSLLEATSNTTLNKVVTGVRFVLRNHIFSIKIKQGQLKANGTIDLETNEWKAIDDRLKKLKFDHLATVDSNDWVTFKGKGLIYAVHDHTKTVNLDDIEPESESPDQDEVVTGLRFRKVAGSGKLEENLRLEIQRTVFDYATGKLTNISKWYSNKVAQRKRTLISLEQPTDPVSVKATNDVSTSGTSVSFRITDLEKDLGQSTIPFIDLQPVEAARPMSGAGIFHRGGKNSGGFLALKLIEYDRSKHMK